MAGEANEYFCVFSVSAPFEWDVHLALSNERKMKARARHLEYDHETLARVLLNQHPRFIWRAVLSIKGRKVLDLPG